ncbi:MAG: sigma 54-interacting transcriptional regulator [Bacteroidales bacterium]|nr:sigma 54-interacting transcriptional regulator [Bacteroidales bacterium]
MLKANDVLIEITRPVIDEMFDFLRGSGFFVILTDRDGCILNITGDDEIVSQARKINIIEGAFMDEKSIGTNSMGIAIIGDCPMQITAEEHFVSALHKWTCSAAPIHDLSGDIIGILNLTGTREHSHLHTLGLAVSAVNAVESRLKNSDIQKQLHNSNEFAFAMMNSLSYGMFAINLHDDILWVNDMACRAINIRRSRLINQPVSDFFPEWSKVKQTILLEKPYVDEEAQFTISGLKDKYLFNSFLIKTKEKEILGFLLTFREFSRVMKTVNKYAGHSTRYTFDDYVGSSPKTKALIKYSKTVAKSSSPILITGESGTGKEIIAQSIHNASNYCDAAFIAINCGAISESLIESELFGYVEGAFTGARKGGRPGKFELANNGTLFLDEIGEMPVNMQVKLLRALQEKAVFRVGSDTPVPVNVRIIAATNKILEIEVKKGNFRLDLFYRLNVVEIKVPPLRERKEDIVPLVHFFLKKKAAKYEKTIPELDDYAISLLTGYDWPGNIRELENLIEKVVIFNGKMSPDFLIHQSVQEETGLPLPSFTEVPETWNLDEIERNTITKALVSFDKNISKVAASLGISRNTLYLKMKKYNIK